MKRIKHSIDCIKKVLARICSPARKIMLPKERE